MFPVAMTSLLSSLLMTFVLYQLITLTEGSRTPLCTARTYNGRQYMLCVVMGNRTQAQDCATFGMRLGMVPSQEEFDFLQQFHTDVYTFSSTWVGATFSSVEKAFVWDTGEIVEISWFGQDPPDLTDVVNRTCVALMASQLLEPEPCSNNLTGYFCQEIISSTKVQIVTPISSDIMSSFNGDDAQITMATEMISVPSFSLSPKSGLNHQATSKLAQPTSITSKVVIQTAMPTSPAAANFISLQTADQTISTARSSSVTDIKVNSPYLNPEASIGSSTTSPSVQEQTASGVEDVISGDTSTHALTSSDETTVVIKDKDDECYCRCQAIETIPEDPARRDVFLQEKVDAIQKELQMEKDSLSATVRKKTSAEDNRPSAKNMGYMGIVLLSLAGATIVCLDLTYFFKAIGKFWKVVKKSP